MDYEMENMECSNQNDTNDKSIDAEWQIDSEWINLSTGTESIPVSNKRGRPSKKDLARFKTEAPPSFHFIPAAKGGQYLVMDNQALRLSQKKLSGYSYWVCSIPFCPARCVLDPDERKLVRFCRDHNHEADISRQEYKNFIYALKLAVKENPHIKPNDLYDAEMEKARRRWRETHIKNNGNEEEPNLPSFDTVRTAMYNSRNAVLSTLMLKATGDENGSSEVPTLPPGPSRTTRSTPSKAVMSGTSDFDELENEWNHDPHRDANLSDFEEWLEDDVNANVSIPPTVVTPSPTKSRQRRTSSKNSSAEKEQHDLSRSSRSDENDESPWSLQPLDGIPRRKYRKRPASSSVFTCPHCPYKSNRHFNVQRHERLAHSTKKPEFSCKECGTSYSLEYRLKLHIKAVHQGEGHHCHICARTFETMTGLKSHIVTKHKNEDPKVQREPPPELTCKLCGRVFSTKSHLQKHTSTHVMVQPYRCCHCNKAFMDEVVWFSHQKTCTEAFTIQCCLCSAFIPTAQELMSHMDVIHGRSEYSCNCGKSFPWKKSLLTHQQKCSLFMAERSV